MDLPRKPGVSRRKFLKGAASASASVVAGRGIYSVLHDYPGPTRAYAATTAYREEQYLIDNLEVIVDNGVPVIIPPIHNDVFTANLQPTSPWGPWNKANLLQAQKQLEDALVTVQGNHPATAAGLTIVVAWGLNYFDTYVPGPWNDPAYALTEWSSTKRAVLKAIPFPSDDPTTLVIENNDVAFKMRSDDGNFLSSVENQLFGTGPQDLGLIGNLFDVTSKRIGFAGRGFGTPSAGKELARKAGLAVAESIPDNAQLMMGFTSTQANALGPDNIPSFETLRRVTNQVPGSYFANGTSMHLSHLYLDLDTWYRKLFDDRVHRMLSPSTAVPPTGTVTLPNGPAQVSNAARVKAEAIQYGMAGHNSALQTATRLGADTLDNYGRLRRKGTPVPAREDFNTLDDPFFWWKGAPNPPPAPKKPGLHFAVFVPASSKFHAARTAMDGVLPDGTDLRQPPYSLSQSQIGFNSQMRATHRQNFVVPPRRHRSFPLAEKL
jgi:hypothetical protein